jgi:hypothetical protein
MLRVILRRLGFFEPLIVRAQRTEDNMVNISEKVEYPTGVWYIFAP